MHPTMDLLTQGTVDIWHIDASTAANLSRFCSKLLSSDEIQRADRFNFERDRVRFITVHAAMRTILAAYLNTTPGEIAFSYARKGKPELAPNFSGAGLRFNLAHSRDHALLAVTRGLSVGIDIEFIDAKRGVGEIANRFFSRQEADALHRLPAELRIAAFFSCWTRKEAYIKALGEGLSLPLDSFDVAFGPQVTPALLRVDSCSHELSRWRLYDVPAAPGYAADIVVEGQEHRLQKRIWEWGNLTVDPE